MKALESKFKEGHEQTVYLPEDTVEAFSCVLQWIYTHIITLLEDGEVPLVDFYLDIVTLAERLDIYGVHVTVAQDIKKIIMKDCDALTSAHVLRATKLSVYNPVRILFAQYSVKLFVLTKGSPGNFVFNDIVSEDNPFATDLLTEFREVYQTSTADGKGLRIYDEMREEEYYL